jgi:hypothetical protein
MKQTFKVTYTDGRVHECHAGARELIEFERKYGASVQQFGKDAHLEWLYFVAYLAMQKLHRQGGHDGAIKASFDAWLDIVESVEPLDADAPLDETAS